MGDDDEVEASPLDFKSPEEMMTPLERIHKSYTSDNMLDRYTCRSNDYCHLVFVVFPRRYLSF